MTEQFARNEIDAEISFSPAEDCSGSAAQAAVNDNRAADILLDQYYTRQEVADHFYDVFQQHFDPLAYVIVEPSAGTGSFYKLLPRGRLGYDVELKYPGRVLATAVHYHLEDRVLLNGARTVVFKA